MMNKILSVIGLLSIIALTSCKRDDVPGPEEARPHAEVYLEDLAKIEDYLQSHYIKINDDNGNGKLEVTEVVMDSINAENPISIWDQTDYPLQYKIVKLYGVDFKVYFLKLDAKGDTDADGKKPCGVDKVWVSYKGNLLNGTQFDIAVNQTDFNLIDVVKGWEYIMPEFRAGYYAAPNGDGVLNPMNYGSGVMFLPSGLGYFNSYVPGETYAPLIFTFNLYDVVYLDQDSDKVLSRYEYSFNSDGTLLDTDGDGIPDVFDGDDDNDGYMTRDEIKINGTYPDFDAILDCSGTTSGIKKHLDASCH
ncbi:FKBP-type peptidyl-prolyl cis-trans isomerase [Flavobacterium suncheonense]|uniref:FKBP-type peptidyl-prolyl cis-trans isomerase n=1 Tax=Flavobacterium suncheonense TaxID=350894 RepID=UPI003FA3DCD5